MVSLAPLGADGHVGTWKDLHLRTGRISNPFVSWSPDSSQIAYNAGNEDAGQSAASVVRLRNIETGEEREVYRGGSCIFAAQHLSLFCSQSNQQTTDVFSVSADSGRTERLGSLSGTWAPYERSGDDRAVYLTNSDLELVQWEIATGRETRLNRWDYLGALGGIDLWQSRLVQALNVEIRPISGGEWKRLYTLNGLTGQRLFSPDGNWIYCDDIDSAGRRGLFRVATSGGQPERLGDFPNKTLSGRILISPNGRNIIAAGLDTNAELSLLENFVPAAR